MSALTSLLKIESQSEISTCGFKITLTKKQQQEYKKAREALSQNKDLQSAYENIKIKKDLTKVVSGMENEIKYIETYVDDLYLKMINILSFWGYVVNPKDGRLDASHIRQKGIIAAQINECNPIILTEIIDGDYLGGMTPAEIISFLSIFTEPIKADIKYESTVLNFTGTPPIHSKIKELTEMINEMQNNEKEIFCNTDDFTKWNISFSYIDIAYKWASGEPVYDILVMLQNMEEYEGNFVKNMLKISNIVNDIQCICKLAGKVEILPALEKVDSLILRDIVSVNSLYLS
jgi:superfamily II RNA helicase